MGCGSGCPCLEGRPTRQRPPQARLPATATPAARSFTQNKSRFALGLSSARKRSLAGLLGGCGQKRPGSSAFQPLPFKSAAGLQVSSSATRWCYCSFNLEPHSHRPPRLRPSPRPAPRRLRPQPARPSHWRAKDILNPRPCPPPSLAHPHPAWPWGWGRRCVYQGSAGSPLGSAGRSILVRSRCVPNLPACGLLELAPSLSSVGGRSISCLLGACPHSQCL